ncbi:MAG: phasin family protein, partial [Bosea sp. (in: a-proteobacteria)]
MQQFEGLQKAGKENVDAALKSFGVASKGVQAIAVESTDYAKKSFEQGTAAFEKLA